MADEYKIEKYATFLNNLEQWIDATILQDGISEEQVIMRIKDSYKRSLQANIDYHSQLAKTSKEAGEHGALKRHTMFINVYKALLEPK
jgi:hypothetical protein